MGIRWFVVLNAEKARVFRARDFELLDVIENRLGREKNAALTTDKPGIARNKFIGASGVHALTGEKDPHEDAVRAFAKEVNSYLDKALGAHRFDTLLVVAEPRMTGRLRAEMSKFMLERTHWYSADYGKLTDAGLRKKLGEL